MAIFDTSQDMLVPECREILLVFSRMCLKTSLPLGCGHWLMVSIIKELIFPSLTTVGSATTEIPSIDISAGSLQPPCIFN